MLSRIHSCSAQFTWHSAAPEAEEGRHCDGRELVGSRPGEMGVSAASRCAGQRAVSASGGDGELVMPLGSSGHGWEEKEKRRGMQSEGRRVWRFIADSSFCFFFFFSLSLSLPLAWRLGPWQIGRDDACWTASPVCRACTDDLLPLPPFSSCWQCQGTFDAAAPARSTSRSVRTRPGKTTWGSEQGRSMACWAAA